MFRNYTALLAALTIPCVLLSCTTFPVRQAALNVNVLKWVEEDGSRGDPAAVMFYFNGVYLGDGHRGFDLTLANLDELEKGSRLCIEAKTPHVSGTSGPGIHPPWKTMDREDSLRRVIRERALVVQSGRGVGSLFD